MSRSDLLIVLPRLGLRGRARFYCQRGGIVRLSSIREQSNMIVDAGLNAFATTSVATMTSNVGVGTSNTAPAATQTALIAPVNLGGVARTATTHTGNNTNFFESVPDPDPEAPPISLCVSRRVLKFPAATADTVLREWGFFNAGSGGTMWNRELFRTSGGVPADYTVLTGEELVCQLETYITVPTGDTPASIEISGVLYDLVIRPLNTGQTSAWAPHNWSPTALWDTVNGCQVDTSSNLLNAETGAGFGTAASSRSVAAYTAGTFYRDTTYTWESANVTADIGRMCWSGAGGTSAKWQATFTPLLPKTSTKRLQLTFRTSWGRP